jgi:hypothetical protein
LAPPRAIADEGFRALDCHVIVTPRAEVDAVPGAEALSAGESSPRAIVFVELAERHLDASYRLARAILHDPADAEDATHDAVVTAWRRFSTLRDVEHWSIQGSRSGMRGTRLVLWLDEGEGRPGAPPAK